MQQHQAMYNLLSSLRRTCHALLGEWAYKKNRWDRAEKYLQSAVSQGPGTARIHFMLVTLAFHRGDLEGAALHFRAIHTVHSPKSFCHVSTHELFELLASRLEEWDGNCRTFSGAWTFTSNLTPLPYGEWDGGDDDLKDFSTLREFQRFQKLPPISAEDIRTVDTEKLIRALLNLKL